MSDLSTIIQDLPAAGLLPAGLLFVLGVVLWAAGQRVLRPAFAITGLLLGGGLGWVLGTALVGNGFEIGVPPWACATIIGLVFACLGALVYRVAVAVALSAVLAVASSATVVTVHRIQDSPEDPVEQMRAMVDDANDWLLEPRTERPPASAEGGPAEAEPALATSDARDGSNAGSPPAVVASEAIIAGGLGLDDEARGRLREARGWTEQLIDDARRSWAELPATVRPVLMAAALGGLLTGLLLSTFASRFSVAMVTSFGGSLLWMGSLGVGLTRLGAPWAEWLTTIGAVTLGLWLIISLLGIAIQWTFRPKRADTSPLR